VLNPRLVIVAVHHTWRW